MSAIKIDLFGQPFIEPLRAKQIPLFHEPLPDVKPADREIEKMLRKFPADTTPNIRDLDTNDLRP